MEYANPYHTIPDSKSLRVEQITCWVAGRCGPKYIGGPECSSEGNSFSGWIESSPGEEFTVSWHNNRRMEPMEGVLYIDGILCDPGHLILDEANYPEFKHSKVDLCFVQTSSFTRRNFVFAEVGVARDKGVSRTNGLSPEVGTIKLEIRRITIKEAVSAQTDSVYRDGALSDITVPEGSKESAPHHVQFSEAYPSAPKTDIVHVEGSRIDEEPLYTFTFYYRPIDVLLAKNLIPPEFQEPPAAILPRRRPIITLDPQDTHRQKTQVAYVDNAEYSSSSSDSPPPSPATTTSSKRRKLRQRTRSSGDSYHSDSS
ncbi:hypothetical protein GALMADRAFT_142164 [Galerina marginata CBS 339.88]|uniref:DUF7918 domain-containing protein n=1 Tax=Galerina marginata (strain CBS 339.88) TaxID=685588 RepID=A0A067SUG6_GALM3|nr:hypothetical protein GALMADRAFT_142164 [Galerina marginata CBS 339.88]